MRLIVITVLSFAVLVGCSKGPATATTDSAPSAQTATVRLKDGGSFTGTVKSSDSSAITLVSASGETRTYPMGQVASVNYAAADPGPKPSPAFPASSSSAPARPAATTPAAPPARVVTVPSGVTIEVRNNEAIDSKTAQNGQLFSAVVTQDVQDDQGGVAVPRGSNASLVVREAVAQGKLQGQSELVLDIESLEVGGRKYRVETRDLVEKGREGVGTNKRTAAYTGGMAALGGVIGAIAGGGKGAAIGAGSGAAAGVGLQTVTRGKSVRVPSETILRFTLEQPVQIREIQ
jgi:hypothetical protein